MHRSYLVIQTAFLGDAVLATSVAELIHKAEPDSRISMLVRAGNESLFSNHPFLEEVIIWEKRKSKFSNLLKVIRTIRKRKFDFVINLQRFFSTGLITTCSGAPVRIGFKKNPLSFLFTSAPKHIIGEGVHENDRIGSLVSGITGKNTGKPRLYPGKNETNKVAEMVSKPYVVLFPASVWFTKQLPEIKWVELGTRLSGSYKVVLAGSPADKTLCEKIADSIPSQNVINVAGSLNLLESAALIQGAEMNYVNDSGPLHMASAVNAPVIAFFCSTVPDFGFGPSSDNSRIVETSEKLKCRPCGLHGRKQCPEGHFKCGNGILISDDLIPQ